MAIEKQKIILIAGVVLALLAIVMTKMYLDQHKQAVEEQKRKEIANKYINNLKGIEVANKNSLNWQDFIIRTPKRNELFEYLKKEEDKQ